MSLCLLHNHLLNAHLCARGEVQEVDALTHAAAVNLLSAVGSTVGYHLTHAVVKHIAVLGVVAFDVQGVLYWVGEDADVISALLATLTKIIL